MYGNYGNEGGSYERRSFAPVKEGDEVDVEIEAVGEKGDGIAKIEGFVIFVPNTKAGQTVKVRITKVLRKVGFGEVCGEASEKPAAKEEAAPEESMAEEKPVEEAPKVDAKPAEDSEDF